jgi:hypothetical protein
VLGETYVAGSLLTYGGVGKFSLNGNGYFAFTPEPDYFGPVPVVLYTINNGQGGTSTARLRINVLPVNDPPVAVNDTVEIYQDTTLNGPSVLGNDSDPDANQLTVTVLPAGLPLHGVLQFNSNGTYTYVPASNFYGTDRFIYRLCDNGNPSKCSTAQVNIRVIHVNHSPVIPAAEQILTIFEDDGPRFVAGLTGITDIDNDSLSISFVVRPQNGTAVFDATGNILYTPKPDFNGNDNITFQVCDNGTPRLCACK